MGAQRLFSLYHTEPPARSGARVSVLPPLDAIHISSIGSVRQHGTCQERTLTYEQQSVPLLKHGKTQSKCCIDRDKHTNSRDKLKYLQKF